MRRARRCFRAQLRPRRFNKLNECQDALAGFSREPRLHLGAFHGREDRLMPLLAGRQQPFHRDLAQTARRHVRDAQQTDIVMRVEEHFQVGQKILLKIFFGSRTAYYILKSTGNFGILIKRIRKKPYQIHLLLLPKQINLRKCSKQCHARILVFMLNQCARKIW